MKRDRLIALFLLILTGSCGPALKKEITENELRHHIQYLASDRLEGRMTGSAGDSLAAEYIRKILTRYGLKPLSDDGFQRISVIVSAEAGNGNSLKTGTISFEPGKDFLPASFSSSGTLSAETVFAGYGFSFETDSMKRNDYGNISVKGKWVMILRGDPEPGNPASVYIPFAGDRHKSLVAREAGAAGVLLVSGEVYDREDVLEPLSGGEPPCGIPVIRIKRNVADSILSSSGTSVALLERTLSSPSAIKSFSTGITVEGSSDIIQQQAITRNVVMMLPGTDEKLKNEYVVVGAHFDHLGKGGRGSSSRRPDTVAVHYGADDNASGTAMMMELAGKFAGEKTNKRSLVFVAFTGEEKGLLGSKYFVDNPPAPLQNINAMVNIDMTGRLKETREMQTGGVGTAKGLANLVKSLTDTTLVKPVFTPEGAGPSDHSAFYAKNIPVLFVTTGAHVDYHTPSDTWDKINYTGMKDVAGYVYKITEHLTSDTEKLAFTEAGPPESQSRRPGRRGVSLGIMPDVTGSVKNGLRAELVTPGKPADLGGMKKGDIIISINGKPVTDIEEYMFRLSQLKKGDAVTVEVLRNDKKTELLIQL
ncbi:MAG: M28 family peptidase [Bacteroidales bacterium]|nr:M28 family peptidase [Bacteroidales bacterium]